jgi:hypothetical protein
MAILAQNETAEKRKAARFERPFVYIAKVAFTLVDREPLLQNTSLDAGFDLQSASNRLVVAAWCARAINQ